LYENGFPIRNQDLRVKKPSGTDMAHESASQHHTIRSEHHGPHWIAWVADENGKPEQSVVLVGMTREEAEERAKRWRDGQLRSST
jgi:hydrogenase maturation factor HypF (carbamoyltransferase family)